MPPSEPPGRTVGIIGGMGPEATVLLMQKLIAAVPATDDVDHVPLLVEQNPQVPSRIARLIEGTGDDPAPVLAAMARRLERAGATALAMPCNTAHHYVDAIRSAVTVPFIEMVALSVSHASTIAETRGRIGILASPAVRRIGLFDAPLAAVGLVPVYAAEEEAMLAAIRSIKRGEPDASAHAVLGQASEHLLAEGASVQMIACTEFSMIADAVPDGAAAFDTLDCLVAAIVALSCAAGAPA